MNARVKKQFFTQLEPKKKKNKNNLEKSHNENLI